MAVLKSRRKHTLQNELLGCNSSALSKIRTPTKVKATIFETVKNTASANGMAVLCSDACSTDDHGNVDKFKFFFKPSAFRVAMSFTRYPIFTDDRKERKYKYL